MDHVLCKEARIMQKWFTTRMAFRTTFMQEFLPKNKVQHALTQLETTLYHQGKWSIDKYIDKFWDLIDQAGYHKGLMVVIKFCKAL
jgi:hypothetical protein